VPVLYSGRSDLCYKRLVENHLIRKIIVFNIICTIIRTHTQSHSLAKFNYSVTGTTGDEADFLTTSTLSNGATSPSTSRTSLSTTGTSNMNPSGASGPDLFIYIIVAATGIVALLFVIVLLCMILVYCCSADKKRNHG
jgi:hypothetical protein